MKNLKNLLRMSLASVALLTAMAGTALAGITATPEIDVGITGSAVALLIGGYLVFVSRIRRK
jgi:hypothetical protein